LNLEGYDEIEIVFVHNINADGSNTRTLYTRTEVGKNGEADFVRTDTFLTQRREYNTTLTGISFGDCVLGSNATVYNNHTIPYKIYGIKYERVAPPLADMEWKLVGTVTGNSILTLPNTYNELLCYTLDNANGSSGGFTFHFNADILTTTPIVYRNGYNFNGASLTNLQMTNTTAQITYYVRDGADMLNQCSLKVYYR
jgi:hypothetical protein